MPTSQGRSRKFTLPEAMEPSASPRQLFYLFDFELFACSEALTCTRTEELIAVFLHSELVLPRQGSLMRPPGSKQNQESARPLH